MKIRHLTELAKLVRTDLKPLPNETRLLPELVTESSKKLNLSLFQAAYKENRADWDNVLKALLGLELNVSRLRDSSLELLQFIFSETTGYDCSNLNAQELETHLPSIPFRFQKRDERNHLKEVFNPEDLEKLQRISGDSLSDRYLVNFLTPSHLYSRVNVRQWQQSPEAVQFSLNLYHSLTAAAQEVEKTGVEEQAPVISVKGERRKQTATGTQSAAQTGKALAQAPKPNFNGADFTNQDLSSKRYIGHSFIDANLAGTKCRGTHFSRCRLTGANFKGADLSGANLQKARLERTDFSGANLERAFLGETDLSQAIFSEGTNFEGADLKEANLQGLGLIGANLERVDLTNANLRQANLQGANLSGTDLIKAKLQGANLRGVKLAGANLSNAKLQGADLTGANLEGADLSGADLRGAVLTDAVLDNLSCGGANFDEAILEPHLFFQFSLQGITGKPRSQELQKSLADFQTLTHSVLTSTPAEQQELISSQELKERVLTILKNMGELDRSSFTKLVHEIQIEGHSKPEILFVIGQIAEASSNRTFINDDDKALLLSIASNCYSTILEAQHQGKEAKKFMQSIDKGLLAAKVRELDEVINKIYGFDDIL